MPYRSLNKTLERVSNLRTKHGETEPAKPRKTTKEELHERMANISLQVQELLQKQVSFFAFIFVFVHECAYESMHGVICIGDIVLSSYLLSFDYVYAQ